MKTKPILIVVASLLLLVCIFLFVRNKYLVKPEKGEITEFLKAFNEQIKAGHVDSVAAYFEENGNSKAVTNLINVFINKDSKSKPEDLATVTLNTDDAQIHLLNAELVDVSIPVVFTNSKLPAKNTSLLLKIHKTGAHSFKIIQVDARQFFNDYYVFEKKIKTFGLSDKDLFSPVTIAAFKAAEGLKSKYDSVVWFQHFGNKTFFYVVKGKYDGYSYNPDLNQPQTFKMGLVNPDLKEIIPVKYDLIHNIDGTLEGLIEVETQTKKGLYDTLGHVVVPAEYDEILPLKDGENLGVLRKDNDYYYLNKNLAISDKLADFKIADAIENIKGVNDSYTYSGGTVKNIMEHNSRDYYTSLIVSPSYLVDWQLLPKFIDIQNPTRKVIQMEGEEIGEGSNYYKVIFAQHKKDNDNWLESAFYSVLDDYLGGRAGLYETKKVVLIDSKHNRVFGRDVNIFYGNYEGGPVFTGKCNVNELRTLSDTLFEVKVNSKYDLAFDEQSSENSEEPKMVLNEAPSYHYLYIKNGKLQESPSERQFAFTQYVKMDDSYINGCFVYNKKAVSELPPEALSYMKNEIYAQYHFKFNNEKWNAIFNYKFNRDDKNLLTTVTDSLTEIDKYNINFINQKLNRKKNNTLAAQ